MLADICETMLRVRRSQHDEGQVRLMASAMREMWYAYHVFHGWEDVRKVSIFGSPAHPRTTPITSPRWNSAAAWPNKAGCPSPVPATAS